MSAFDTLAQAAAVEEAKAKGAMARVWSVLPARAPARVEVAVERHRSAVGVAMATLAALTCLACAYRLGGADSRAEFASYVAEERTKAAEAKASAATARSAVEVAATDRADAADKRAASLQLRIDGYVADLARRPVEARCSLTDADLRGLRDGPTAGAATRARHRPARPAPDAD